MRTKSDLNDIRKHEQQMHILKIKVCFSTIASSFKSFGVLNCNGKFNVNLFRGGATFEMIELNTEKCIFRLIQIVVAQRLINGRR